MRLHRLLAPSLSLLFALPAAGPVGAQDREPVPLSQYQHLTQSVGWVDVEVEYRRPVARGRDLFGALVPWDRPWTPSADSAAVLTIDGDVWLSGRAVPAGSYSLWVIPRRPDAPWTVIVSRAARVFHAPYPGGRDLLRFDVQPDTGDPVETLELGFPRVDGVEAVFELRWGTTRLAIPLRVTPPE